MLNEIIKMIELSKNTKGQDWRHNIKQIKTKINEYAKEYHESKVKKLNIPVTNRTYSVDEVKILLEKQKQACANEFIHGEMTMEQAKRRVLNAPTVSF